MGYKFVIAVIIVILFLFLLFNIHPQKVPINDEYYVKEVHQAYDENGLFYSVMYYNGNKISTVKLDNSYNYYNIYYTDGPAKLKWCYREVYDAKDPQALSNGFELYMPENMSTVGTRTNWDESHVCGTIHTVEHKSVVVM